MNKSELVKAVAKSTGIKQVDVSKVIDATLSEITNTLRNDDEISFSAFGCFSARTRAARTVKALFGKEGETSVIESAKVPKFKAYRGLILDLNNK